MRKANYAENEISFVRGSDIWTTDVFTANNQAVTNTVKDGVRHSLIFGSSLRDTNTKILCG